jgi:hypothetical protein
MQNAKLNGHLCCDFSQMLNLMAANVLGLRPVRHHVKGVPWLCDESSWLSVLRKGSIMRYVMVLSLV